MKDDTAWSYPMWSTRLFQATTFAQILISWLVAAPYFDQVHWLKGSERLAHSGVAELRTNSSSSSANSNFFSFLSSLHQPLEVHGGVKLAEGAVVLIRQGVLTSEGPLECTISSSEFCCIQCRCRQRKSHLRILPCIFKMYGSGGRFHILNCSFHNSIGPWLLLWDEVRLDIQL